MELKTARLTLLIDPAKKAAFERLCAKQDVTPSQVVRRLIREYLAAHDVKYRPSGATEDAGDDASRSDAGRRPGAARVPRAKSGSGGGAR